MMFLVANMTGGITAKGIVLGCGFFLVSWIGLRQPDATMWSPKILMVTGVLLGLVFLSAVHFGVFDRPLIQAALLMFFLVSAFADTLSTRLEKSPNGEGDAKRD